MKLEYIVFLLFFFPWIKGLWGFARNNKEAENKKQKTREKNTMTAGLTMVVSSIPFIGAYFYADLKYIWIVIGMFYLILGVITFIMGNLAVGLSKRQEMAGHQEAVKEKCKDIDFWPKWQVKALCGYQVLIFLLWLYSWRNLID